MTDKETQVLLSTPIDQETLNKALAGLAALSTALEKVKKESQDVSDVGSASKGPSFGERIGQGATAAIGKFNSLGEKVKSVASEVVEFGERSFKTLAKLGTGVALAGLGVIGGSARSFSSTYAGIDPQANAQNKASAEVKRAFDDLGRVSSRLVTPALESLATALEATSQFLGRTFPQGQENPVSYFINKAIPKAAQALSDLAGIVLGVGAILKRDVGNAIDTFITTLRASALSLRDGFAKAINGLLDALATIVNRIDPHNLLGGTELAAQLRGSKDLSAEGGDRKDKKSAYQLQAEQELKDLADRITGRNKEAADFGSILVTLKSGIENFFKGGLQGAASSAKASLDKPRITTAEVDAFNARNEALAKADADYEQNRKDAKVANDKAIERLDKDHNRALEQLAKSQNEAERNLTDNYNRDKLKSQEQYNNNEAQIERENQLKREQDLRRHELTLRELAAEGDVAGFVNEQKNFALDQTDQTEQANLAKQERQKAFADENRDRDEQYQHELQALHDSGQQRLDEINQQYAEQQAEQQTAYNEQITALRRNHDQQRTEIDRDFARQLSQLDSNLGGLQTLRNRDYANQLQALDTFIKTQQGYLQNLYQTAPGVMANGASGGSAGNTYVNIESGAVQNTVGDVATQSQLNEVQSQTVSGIVQAFGQSRGRSAATAF